MTDKKTEPHDSGNGQRIERAREHLQAALQYIPDNGTCDVRAALQWLDGISVPERGGDYEALAVDFRRMQVRQAAARDALERARGCIKGLLAQTPVRDVTETLAEIDATIDKLRANPISVPTRWPSIVANPTVPEGEIRVVYSGCSVCGQSPSTEGTYCTVAACPTKTQSRGGNG